MTLLRPYGNWKGKLSAHQRPQQLPVSLDHGTERIRLAWVLSERERGADAGGGQL